MYNFEERRKEFDKKIDEIDSRLDVAIASGDKDAIASILKEMEELADK